MLFAFGMLCALFQDWIKAVAGNIGWRVSYVYILLGSVCATIANSVLRDSFLGDHATTTIMLSSALVFVAMLCTPVTGRVQAGPVKSFLINVGDASYSIYIFHSLVLTVLIALFAQIAVDSVAVRMIAYTIVPAICSMAMYYLIELPLRSSVEIPLRRSLGAPGGSPK